MLRFSSVKSAKCSLIRSHNVTAIVRNPFRLDSLRLRADISSEVQNKKSQTEIQVGLNNEISAECNKILKKPMNSRKMNRVIFDK